MYELFIHKSLDKLEQNSSNTQFYSDGFSRDKDHNAFVPNVLFWSDEDNKYQGLLTILNRYNFTVEENTPTDIQIALDPEMLGKVFENLLGTHNPETYETARKASGSFYTPREIVDFMVDSSLEAYLITELPNHSEATIKVLFDDFVEGIQIEEKYKAEIIDALRKCKILDPACGSGAFPMGILHRIVSILLKLGYCPGEETLYESTKYLIKKELIEQCIFGIDIQPIAVQIAKLRFFISLVCEQEKKNDPNQNYGITPLPNLETKFVVANSLLSLPQSSKEALRIENEHILLLSQNLATVRKQHFTAKTAKDKKELRAKDLEIREGIILYLGKTASFPNPKLISQYEEEIKNLEQAIETLSITKEFEVLTLFGTIEIDQDNPNEANLKDARNALKETKKKLIAETNKSKTDQFTNQLQDLIQWNPYDQSAVSEFFDLQWMFGEKLKKGFDIIIGNPPYIQLQANSGKLAKLYEHCGYETFTKTGDIYCLFFERGFHLLKHNGHLCYITSNKWMRADYGQKTRNYFISHTNPELLIDFGSVQVFENAMVDTNILLFQKTSNRGNTRAVSVTPDQQNEILHLKTYINNHAVINNYSNDELWAVLTEPEIRIKNKVDSIGKPLKDWNISIKRGVLTGYNKAFIIDDKTRAKLISEDPSSAEIIKPIIRGQDIRRYRAKFQNIWLIATFPALSLDINRYPAVRDYLRSFGRKLEQVGESYITEDGKKEKTRKKTGNNWFETQDQIAYYEDFQKDKIAWNRIASTKIFSYIDADYYLHDSTHFFTGENIKFLCGVLNSKLISFLFNSIIGEAVGGNAGNSNSVKNLKIPEIPREQQEQLTNLIDSLLKLQENGADTNIIEQKIDLFVYKLYQLTHEEIVLIDPNFSMSKEHYNIYSNARP